MNEVLFSEKQGFRQWWILLILGGINGAFLYGVVLQLIVGQPFGDKPMDDIMLLIMTGVVVFVTFLILSARLDTIIKKDGIYVRFFPFHLKFKCYSWDSLTKVYVRQYSPLTEYGGWGMRIGLKKGRAMNVSGNKGLQLEFTDNKKLLIGTNKPDELIKVLELSNHLKVG